MDSEKSLYDLLAEAQEEIQNPKKFGRGQVGSRIYNYATLDDVLECVKPPLNKRGIFLTQRTEQIMGRSEDGTPNVFGIVIQTIVAKGGTELVLDNEPYEFDKNPQEYGKRETYAKRYSLCKAFAITGDEDTDGDVKHSTKPQAKPSTKSQPTVNQQAGNQRKSWVDRLKQLEQECISKGLDPDAMRQQMFGDLNVDAMDIDQMKRYGKALNDLEA